MPEPAEAFEMVRDDVMRGLGEWLVDTGDIEMAGFRLLDEFERESEGVWNESTGTVAVPWGFRGRHEADLMGFRPTGRVIDVRGVTLVHIVEGQDDPQFARFVDWTSALAEMGVGLFTRSIRDLDLTVVAQGPEQ